MANPDTGLKAADDTIFDRLRGVADSAYATSPYIGPLSGLSYNENRGRGGFISNPEQEKQLASDGFQSMLVQALLDRDHPVEDVVGVPHPIECDRPDPLVQVVGDIRVATALEGVEERDVPERLGRHARAIRGHLVDIAFAQRSIHERVQQVPVVANGPIGDPLDRTDR